MQSQLYICRAEISSAIKAVLVCGQGMRYNDCTQHVLDGPVSVCTLVELCCAHVVVCQCLSCVAILVEQLKQMPFSSQKMAPHTFSVLSRFILFFSPRHSHQRTSVSCVCRQQWTESASVPEVFVVGINVIDFRHQYNHKHTYCLYVFCDLTPCRFLLAVEPPSGLKFKILNENSVEMSWVRPSARIDGFRIQVVSEAGQYEVSMIVCCWSKPTNFIRAVHLTFDFPFISCARWTGQRLYPWCVLYHHVNHWPHPWLGLLSFHTLLLWVRGEYSHLWTTDQ